MGVVIDNRDNTFLYIDPFGYETTDKSTEIFWTKFNNFCNNCNNTKGTKFGKYSLKTTSHQPQVDKTTCGIWTLTLLENYVKKLPLTGINILAEGERHAKILNAYV